MLWYRTRKQRIMTMQCIDAIKDAEVIVGYKTYINLITDLIEGKSSTKWYETRNR
ncbi:MAG: hypothetical protein ACLT9V_02545 [Anaerococcus obesiensis]